MRPLRDSDPEKYRLVTIRTFQGKLLMKPNRRVRRMIGGVIARYQELLNIEIYAYQYLSNHPHLIVRAPESNLDEFMENVNREVARRCNFYLHREGTFWSRRYDDQEILTESDLLEAFLYVTTNPCRHGLVSDARDWSGLNCFQHVLDERDRVYSFHHYSATNEEEKVTTHRLKITPLPQFNGLRKQKRREKLLALLEQRMEETREGRYNDGGGFIGMEIALQCDPEDVPKNMSRSPRPPCYTFHLELRRRWREKERARRRAYRIASIRYRLGDLTVEFPPHTYRPPLHRKPRISRFVLLTNDFFNQDF